MVLLPGSTHQLLSPSTPTNPLLGPRSLPGSRAGMCAGIYPSRESDGEENTGWSRLLHKGNVEVSFLPLVGFLRGWGEIKQDLNTFTAPFPPHFPVNLLLSWYLSEDIFSFALSSPLPTPISGF